jgi:hypothetical protein
VHRDETPAGKDYPENVLQRRAAEKIEKGEAERRREATPKTKEKQKEVTGYDKLLLEISEREARERKKAKRKMHKKRRELKKAVAPRRTPTLAEVEREQFRRERKKARRAALKNKG